jgi:hypothetical protein
MTSAVDIVAARVRRTCHPQPNGQVSPEGQIETPVRMLLHWKQKQRCCFSDEVEKATCAEHGEHKIRDRLPNLQRAVPSAANTIRDPSCIPKIY